MSIEQMIAVLEAFKAGKTIQFASKEFNPRQWFDVSDRNPAWNFVAYEYRVKPEPLVLYANVYGNANSEYVGNFVSYDREAVIKRADGTTIRTAAKFVEVIE